jgi:4-hydroxy-tetrahydrodipicolinate synthase
MAEPFPISGNIPAVVTPFDAKGRIDHDAFDALLEWHLARGVDGICVAGDNGESWALSPADRRRLTEQAVRAAAGRVPVVTGASAPTAAASIAYAEAIADTGVAALMVGPQAYVMKATTRELVARMERIHDAVPLPVVLYNSPRRTGISLTTETMNALTEAVPIVALKEATRDFFYLTHVIQEFGSRLAVLVGPAPFILPGLQLGAAGFISSGPEFFGAETAHAARSGGAPLDQRLRDLHYRYTRIYETLMQLGTWPAAMKAAHTALGLPAGVPHEPVLPLEGAELATLHRVLDEVGATAAVERKPEPAES